jgi:hypothetical protein
MAFSVQHHTSFSEFTDDDMYAFEPDGILKVTSGDQVVDYYLPATWQRVYSTNGHKPGPLKTGRPPKPMAG